MFNQELKAILATKERCPTNLQYCSVLTEQRMTQLSQTMMARYYSSLWVKLLSLRMSIYVRIFLFSTNLFKSTIRIIYFVLRDTAISFLCLDRNQQDDTQWLNFIIEVLPLLSLIAKYYSQPNIERCPFYTGWLRSWWKEKASAVLFYPAQKRFFSLFQFIFFMRTIWLPTRQEQRQSKYLVYILKVFMGYFKQTEYDSSSPKKNEEVLLNNPSVLRVLFSLTIILHCLSLYSIRVT